MKNVMPMVLSPAIATANQRARWLPTRPGLTLMCQGPSHPAAPGKLVPAGGGMNSVELVGQFPVRRADFPKVF
jgi:hypothetical protein